MAPIAVIRGSLRSLRLVVHSAAAEGSDSSNSRNRSGASVTIVRNFKHSKCFPLKPTRLWRNRIEPGEVDAIRAKQMINNGANRIIPARANKMSTVRLRVIPTGIGEPIAEKGKALRVSAKLFMPALQRNISEKPATSLFLITLILCFFRKLSGTAQLDQARILCKTFVTINSLTL